MKQVNRVNKRTMLYLLGILVISCLFVFHNYIFGDKVLVFTDVGDDTAQQYIMWYNGIANHLRSGELPSFDFYNGLGASLYNLNLFAPFLWIAYLIGAIFGPQHIAGSMVYIFMLEIILAGLFAYIMLSAFSYREEAKAFAAYMYAFNGYLMIWGQHYSLGSVLVWMPLLIWYIEKSRERKRNLFGASGISGLIILNGYYQGYMVMLGVGIYVTLRVLLAGEERIKERAVLFFQIAGSMAFGVVMGAANLLPSYMTVRESSRLGSGQSLIAKMIANMSLWEKEYYRTLIYRFFGNNLQGSGNDFMGYLNYYEAIELSFSVLFILLAAQYVWGMLTEKEPVRKKLAKWLGAFVIMFMVIIEAGSLPFNGFAYAFMRHAFLFMPLFAMISAASLTKILEQGKMRQIPLVIGTLILAAVYAKAYMNNGEAVYQNNTMILLLGGVGMAVSLWMFTKKRLSADKLVLILGALLIVTVASDAGLTVRYRRTVLKSDTTYFQDTYQGDTQEALSWIRSQDEGFYRIEKDYTTSGAYLEGMVQGYYGVSSYNSLSTSGMRAFTQNLWPQLYTGYDFNHYQYKNAYTMREMSSLAGVKYILSKSALLERIGYTLVHQCGSVYIYKNEGVENIAGFYTKTWTQRAYKKQADELDSYALLSDVLLTAKRTDGQISEKEAADYKKSGVEDLIAKDRIDESIYHETGAGVRIDGHNSVVLPINQEVLQKYAYVYADITIEAEDNMELKIYADDLRLTEYFLKQEHTFTVRVPSDTKEITITAAYGSGEFVITDIAFYGGRSENVHAQNASITVEAPKGSRVSGSVKAEEDGYVMLAIPYLDGWQLTVDGQKTDIITAEYNFTAFPVSRGEHDFTLTFHAPLGRESMWISLISGALWLIMLIISSIRNRNSIKKQQKSSKRNRNRRNRNKRLA